MRNKNKFILILISCVFICRLVILVCRLFGRRVRRLIEACLEHRRTRTSRQSNAARKFRCAIAFLRRKRRLSSIARHPVTSGPLNETLSKPLRRLVESGLLIFQLHMQFLVKNSCFLIKNKNPETFRLEACAPFESCNVFCSRRLGKEGGEFGYPPDWSLQLAILGSITRPNEA